MPEAYYLLYIFKILSKSCILSGFFFNEIWFMND